MKLLKIIMSDDDADSLTRLLEEQEAEGTFDEGFTIQVEHIGKDAKNIQT